MSDKLKILVDNSEYKYIKKCSKKELREEVKSLRTSNAYLGVTLYFMVASIAIYAAFTN